MGANQSNGGDGGPERGRAGENQPNYQPNRGYQAYTGGHHQKKGKAKPGPPLKVKITHTSHNSVSLSWMSPRHADGSSVIAYTVEMLIASPGSDKQWKVLTKSCQGTSYDARHLEPNTDYVFRVRAENVYGTGKSSSPSDVATTNMFETLPSEDFTLSVPQNSDTTDNKPNSSLKRRHSFNMHLEGGVTAILNHSDIVVSSKSGSPNSTSKSSSDNSTHSSLQRNSVQRTSLQNNRKISLPILLPGTGTNSLNRLRESRNSLRTSVSDLQITTPTQKEATRNKFRDSRTSFGSSNSDMTTSTSNGDDTKKQLEGSRSSLMSAQSDATLPCSKDSGSGIGSKNSLCDSANLTDQADGIDSSSAETNTDIRNNNSVEPNNNKNNNNNNNKNETNNEGNNEINCDDDDDVLKLKEELKKLDINEDKLKFYDLREKRFVPESIFSQTDNQKGYYESLENPWERDTSVDGVSERIRAAPFCDDVKMALYARTVPEEQRDSVGHNNLPGNLKPGAESDFRTLRSVLQSNNMIVKTSRSLPDVVGVVMGEGGEARTLTRGKLTTILDADEEEDPVRVTTL